MRILISGIGGRMGRALCELAGDEVVGGVDIRPDDVPAGIPCAADFAGAVTDVDVVIDFSHHTNTDRLLTFAAAHGLPLVLATTGQTEDERAAIRSASRKIPLFFAANYSLGIVLLTEWAKAAASVLPDAEIEIVEVHHDRKLDAPSGTALALAEAIREVRPGAEIVAGRSGTGKRTPTEIGIHSLRMGNVVGQHEVIVATPYQTITLKHEAHSRALFAEGALAAARFLIGKPAGLYDMKSLISR